METPLATVTTDQLPPLTERGDLDDVETWTGEWHDAERTSHTVADSDFLSGPTWPALPPLSMPASYLLLLLAGVLGVHQFYLRNWARGGLYLLTLGGLGIAVAVDLFTLPRQLERANALRTLGLR